MKKKIIKLLTKSDKFFLFPLTISTFSFLFITIFFFLFYQKLPPKLPLFYSLPWGEPQLGSKEQFLLLPTILILTTLTNTLIASQLHPLQFVLKRILMLSLVFINLIILVTALKILLIFI